MKKNYLMMFSLLGILICQAQSSIQNYGTVIENATDLYVPLSFSDFEYYGDLKDRIREVSCHDSIPLLVILDGTVERHIFPLIHCIPPPSNPPSRHFATLKGSNIYRSHAHDDQEINKECLAEVIQEDYEYYDEGVLNCYLVIIEAAALDRTDEIAQFSLELTQAFDGMANQLPLRIAYWTIVPPLPEPPYVTPD